MFNAELWALNGNWSWQRICQVAESGLDAREARALVTCFGPTAPRMMTAWCESKVVGTCAVAGWEWQLQLEEYGKLFEECS